MSQAEARIRAIKRSLLLILTVVVAEIAAGLYTGSLALLGDAAHAFFDALVTAMLLAASALASKPPDSDHTYGHEKIESLGSLTGGFLLAGFSLLLIYEALSRIQRNLAVNPGLIGVTAASYTLVVDLARIYVLRGPSVSPAVRADMLHAVSDCGSTIVALIGISTSGLGFRLGDPIASIILGVFLIYLSSRLIRDSFRDLSDRVSPVYVEAVKSVIRRNENVKGIRRLMVRRAGMKTYVDAYISVNGGQTIDRAHIIASQLEKSLKRRFKNITAIIHVEPSLKNMSLQDLVRSLCFAVKGVREVHKISATNVGKRLFLTVHILVDSGISLDEAHGISDKVEALLYRGVPSISKVLIHIEPLDSAIKPGNLIKSDEISIILEKAAKEWKEIRSIRVSSIVDVKGKLIISINCGLDRRLPIEKAHNIIEAVKKILKKSAPSALIEVHSEPDKGSER